MNDGSVRTRIQSCHVIGLALHREIMHRQVGWMKAADMSILRVLDTGLALRTSDIAYNADLSRGYTSERLRELVEHDLVVVEGGEQQHPRYRISDKGQAAYNGDISPEELEESSS